MEDLDLLYRCIGKPAREIAEGRVTRQDQTIAACQEPDIHQRGPRGRETVGAVNVLVKRLSWLGHPLPRPTHPVRAIPEPELFLNLSIVCSKKNQRLRQPLQ